MTSNQEIFNKVYRGLQSQGFKQSTRDSGEKDRLLPFCQLRSGCGKLKCAVGWIIPDEEYEPSLDSLGSIDGMFIHANRYPHEPNSKKISRLFKGMDREFLHRLQRAHDGGVKPDYMKKSLEDLAIFYDLTVPKEA